MKRTCSAIAAINPAKIAAQETERQRRLRQSAVVAVNSDIGEEGEGSGFMMMIYLGMDNLFIEGLTRFAAKPANAGSLPEKLRDDENQDGATEAAAEKKIDQGIAGSGDRKDNEGEVIHVGRGG